MLAKGELPVALFERVTALLALDRGATIEAVAVLVGVTDETVATWRSKYRAKGLAGLPDEPR